MSDFMKDRYGVDELTYVLGLLGVVLALIGSFAGVLWLSWVALAVIVYTLWRSFSKDIEARRRENEGFVNWALKVPVLKSLVTAIGGPAVGGQTSSYSYSNASNDPVDDHEREKRAKQAQKDAERAQKQAERDKQQRINKKKWENRKTTKYIECPTCGQTLAVPKGKGKIRVTCPKCGTKVETKS